MLAFSDRDYGLYVLKYTGPRPGTVAAGRCPAAPAPPGRGARRHRARGSRCCRTRGRACSTLRTNGLKFRIRVNEAAKLEVKLRGRFTSTKRGARGKSQKLKSNRAINVAAGQTVTVTLKPSAALRRKLRKREAAARHAQRQGDGRGRQRRHADEDAVVPLIR